MKHTFIVLEGVDGTGKTSVAKSLAQKMNAEYVLTPMPPLDEILVPSATTEMIKLTHYINHLNDTHVRFCYYLWAVLHASHRIREILQTHDVICDRYIASTLAYHAALDPKLRNFEISKLDILRPDYEFMLTVSDDGERQNRLKKRPDQNRGDDFIEKDLQFLKTIEQEYLHLGIRPIETFGKSIDQVSNLLLSLIRIENIDQS